MCSDQPNFAAQYPHTVYIAAGTQADVPQNNKLMVLKMSQLCKTRQADDSGGHRVVVCTVAGVNFNPNGASLLTPDEEDEEESDSEETEDDPMLEYRHVRHPGGVNRLRVRATPLPSSCCDTVGCLALTLLASHAGVPQVPQPHRHVGRHGPRARVGHGAVYKRARRPLGRPAGPHRAHLHVPGAPGGGLCDGLVDDCPGAVGGSRGVAVPVFAASYVAAERGCVVVQCVGQRVTVLRCCFRLLTGDCRKHIYLWNMHEGGSWAVDKVPFNGHAQSVEDLQWSPTESEVCATQARCSVSIRLCARLAHMSLRLKVACAF
eukprot:Opistho-1_new@37277